MNARVLALAMLVTIAAPARAEEPVRHVVKQGDSCSSIALQYYGDTRFVDLLHEANPEIGRVPPPHVLRPGTALIIPPRPGTRTGPDAQLTAVKNQVDVMTPERKAGKPNDPLFRGNRVSTEAASAADVTFRDETQVKLGERTLVIILGDAKSAASKLDVRTSSETTLVTGNLRAFLGGANKQTAVTTDAARVRVFDGNAQVSADARKTTRLAVYGGSGAIDASGKQREVSRGFGSKAEIGQPPTAPRPLPGAPVWMTPPPLVILDRGSPSITADYDVPGATEQHVAEWHVQVGRDGIFRDVAVDTQAPVDIRRLEARLPGAGRYYVRVSAIDDDHFEGPWSRVVRTLVVKATASADRLEIEPSDAFCVRVGNVPLTRIEGGSLAVRPNEPIRIRCAPSELDPTTLFELN